VGLVGLNWAKHTRQVTKQSRSNSKPENDEQQSKAHTHTRVKPSNTNRGNSIQFKAHKEN
jgi:hypothetical protein